MPQPSSTIVEPRLACRSGKQNDPIECSLHTLPKPLMREFKHVFAEKYLNGDTSMGDDVELLAIPTNQHARHDLVAVGDEIEAEKDRLLNCVGRQFCFFACCAIPTSFFDFNKFNTMNAHLSNIFLLSSL